MQSKVVVVTGASSGIGRAAAVEFARRGAKVVVAARRMHELQTTAWLCQAAGGEASALETDVTDEKAVKRLAAHALDTYGRIDVWVNNAGVTAFGPLDEGSFDVHRRVIETNVFGAMYGARAVLPLFKQQGAGVLINVGSILSKVGQPYVPSYVVSKFALRGLSETLRTAVADHPHVHVCTLLPYAVDTPHFQEGANRVGLDAHAMAPMQSPESVARALVDLAVRPRREVHVPRVAALGLALHQLFPDLVERTILHLVREWHFGHQRLPTTTGNLFEPGKQPAGMHGERGQRTTLAGMLLWLAGHALRSVAGTRTAGQASLQPHSSP